MRTYAVTYYNPRSEERIVFAESLSYDQATVSQEEARSLGYPRPKIENWA